MTGHLSTGDLEDRVTAQATAHLIADVRRLSQPRQAQIPSTALRAATPTDGADVERAPLLAMLDRGDVRLKLYLWLRWYAQHSPGFEPAPLRLSHLEWAQLLALPDPAGNGTKRVSAALKWLDQHGYLTRGTDRPASVKPTDLPAWPLARDQPATGYAALPIGFWTGQWIGGLSGRAIGALLILIDSATPRLSMPTATKGPATYIAESILTGTYGVSEDFYRLGRQELQDNNLVTSRLNKRWARQKGGWSGLESALHVATLRDTPHPRFATLLSP
jgi:hypothetical protein